MQFIFDFDADLMRKEGIKFVDLALVEWFNRWACVMHAEHVKHNDEEYTVMDMSQILEELDFAYSSEEEVLASMQRLHDADILNMLYVETDEGTRYAGHKWENFLALLGYSGY
jgi:hypothetical protein